MPAAARKKRKAAAGSHDNEERWLLTYADMITLLLVLFVVLFAMSDPSIPKFLAFRNGITAAFNPSAISTNGGNGLMEQTSLQSTTSANSSITPLHDKVQASTNDTASLAKAIEASLRAKHLTGDATVTQSANGVVVEILADKVFFASDIATLGTVGQQIVDAVGAVIASYPNRIEVEGYTDSQPVVAGPFSSNWELSAVRAANVVERLNTIDGINTDRLSSVGYGSNSAIASNSTPAGRQLNRRIDVAILQPQG
jgi:chemotaxis protein MotB